MSIHVPSPSYGSVAGPFAGSSDRLADRSDDPVRAPADPTTSGEPVHAANPTRQSSAHARAAIDLMHHPPAAPAPKDRERRNRPKVRFDRARVRCGRVRLGTTEGGAAPARMGA